MVCVRICYEDVNRSGHIYIFPLCAFLLQFDHMLYVVEVLSFHISCLSIIQGVFAALASV